MRQVGLGLLAVLLFVTGCAGVSETGRSQEANKAATKKEIPPTRPAGKVAWRAIGPGVGGANFAVCFHPTDPKIMLAGTDMGVLFRTEDSGKSWTMVGSASGGKALPGYRGGWNAVFDPKRPDIAWAASEHAVCKSMDAGKTWERVTASIGGEPLAFQCIGIDPTDTDIVYIGQGWVPRLKKGWAKGRIWKTLDGGKTWAELPRPGGLLEKDPVKDRNYTNVLVDPSSPFEKGRGHARVFVYGRDGLFVSNDAGQSWESLAEKLPAATFGDMAIVADKGKSIIFVTMHPVWTDEKKQAWTGGIYRSEDEGKTWRPSHDGMEKAISTLAGLNKGNPQWSLMLARSPAAPAVLYAGSVIGLFRSDDLGKSWRQVSQPNDEWLKTKDWDDAERYYRLRRQGTNFVSSYKGGIDSFYLLAAAPSDANLVAFTDNITTTLSRDGGKTWEDILFDYADPFDAGRFGDRPPMMYTHRVKDRGAQVIVPCEVAVDPFDPKTIFVAYMDLALRISRDNGVSWEYPTRNILARGYGYGIAYSVLFDPAVKGKAWVAFGYEGRVYLTEDGGRTFRQVGIEPLLTEAEIQSKDKGKSVKYKIWQLALDPQSPPDKRVLYAASSFGVYKSEDGGNSWKDSSFTLDAGSDVRHLVVNPDNPEILYAGANPDVRRDPDGAGLYRSRDAGRNWVRLAPDKLGTVLSLSMCRDFPDTVYVIACAPGKAGFWEKGKLWRTDDGGESWRLLDERRGSVVGVHPKDPNYLYYGFYAQDLNKEPVGFVRSRDGGKSWDDVAVDIPLSHPTRVCFDGNDPRRFFLLESFSVFEGRDDGAPSQ